MEKKEISVPGITVAAVIALLATALVTTDMVRFAKLGLFLFCFSWLVFYIAVAMPFTLKRKSSKRTTQ